MEWFRSAPQISVAPGHPLAPKAAHYILDNRYSVSLLLFSSAVTQEITSTFFIRSKNFYQIKTASQFRTISVSDLSEIGYSLNRAVNSDQNSDEIAI